MEFAIVIFGALFLLLFNDFLNIKEPPKTPEEELGNAIAKYLTTAKKGDEIKSDEQS